MTLPGLCALRVLKDIVGPSIALKLGHQHGKVQVVDRKLQIHILLVTAHFAPITEHHGGEHGTRGANENKERSKAHEVNKHLAANVVLIQIPSRFDVQAPRGSKASLSHEGPHPWRAKYLPEVVTGGPVSHVLAPNDVLGHESDIAPRQLGPWVRGGI